MAIYEVSDTVLRQGCSVCGKESQIALDRIEVGVVQGDLVDGRIIPLPPCAGCGAAEFLIQSLDDDAPSALGDFGHLHRLLVDHVHAVLVGRNRVVKQLRGRSAKQGGVSARPVDPTTLQRWFPAGLRIDPKDLDVPMATDERKENASG